MSELNKGALLQGGKYIIEKSLGQGGFGITYLAEQTNLGRKVCIKEFFMKEYGERTAAKSTEEDETVLTTISPVTTAAGEIMERYRAKFIKEAKTIARLDHPGIVRIHDVFEENGTAYYVMDYIEGESLYEKVKRDGPLDENRALECIHQAADALSYVHSNNIMHLDFKPANILIRKSDNKAILIDFGTSKQYDSDGSQTSTTPVGLSAGYAPLELMKVGGVQTFSPETDVYSLGATLYYLVTGHNPPDASERMEMIMEGETLTFPTDISAPVTTAIEKALQSRKKRPQTVAEFIGLLPEKKTAKPQLVRPDFCTNCGEKLAPTANFCSNCGAKIQLIEVSNTQISEAETKESEEALEAVIGSGQFKSSGSGRFISDDIFENMPGGNLLDNKVLPKAKKSRQSRKTMEALDLSSISAVCQNNQTVFNVEVQMPPEIKTLYVYFSFSRYDSPIYYLGANTLHGSLVQFGGNIRIDNIILGRSSYPGCILFDLSKSALVNYGDGEIIFDLNIIMSTRPSITQINDDDVIHIYRFSINHVSHIFKHDDWNNVKLIKKVQ